MAKAKPGPGSSQVREHIPPNGPRWLICDGQGLRQLAQAGLAWLEHHESGINALNVFPVPDGDTGTNMMLTMRSACDEVGHSADHHAGRMARALAHGALMGARGNSGVILSQLLRGFARAVGDLEAFDAAAFVRGLSEGRDTAYKGVMRPVEGTILTVACAAAAAAEEAVKDTNELRQIMERVVACSHEAVALTPSLLPILRDAGVVDAGGQGLAILLEGMLRAMRGESLEAGAARVSQPGTLPSQLEPRQEGYGYDVQFLLRGHNLDIDEVRAAIGAMGESTLVVGDANTIKVHVHVHDPGVPLSYGASKGTLSDVVVENMQEQYQRFIADRLQLPEPGNGQIASKDIASPAPSIAVVAIMAGAGLARVFSHDLGAAAIVDGGQSMNPSTEEILRAVESVPSDRVIILPNNRNVILAAEQARKLSPKSVAVVPTQTIPEGVAAMLALDPTGELDQMAARMTEAAREVTSGEVTTATRAVNLDGVQVEAGQIIGLVAGTLVAAGSHRDEVVIATLEHMGLDHEPRHVTLYYGDSVQPPEARTLAASLQSRYPQHEIEVIEGGQPYYHYLLSVE